ncbi:MAG: extracellular solute-binding protein [Treponema sp.]|jgi:ABC-type glycerol-3-phosphate transport system substrate-binding protein|nr:extracellular solute-binding protein [Treponema sp.]
MKKSKLYWVFLLASVFFTAQVWAGGGKDSFKGKTIVLGSFWENYNVKTSKPVTENDELILEWRKKAMQEHGFNMEVKQIADWGNMLETITTSVMAGRPAAQAFYVSPDWAMSLYRQKLLAALNSGKVVDLTTSTPIIGKQVDYNQDIAKLFTFGGKQYAIAIGYGASAHDDGVYFNKRLFREAGLDPNLLYDMQKAGTWNWDSFLDIAKKLTRDRNNSGRIDTYAMPADVSVSILDQLVYSNGANYVVKDASGKFVNATGRPEFLEALQFARRLHTEGIMMPRPEGSAWDWFFPAFTDGHVAMMMEANWRAGQLMETMADDWGYVLCPKGPKSANYRTGTDENVIVISSVYKADEVDAILAAINFWYMPVTDNWKVGNYNRYRDSRAIDETLVMTRDPKYTTFKNWMMIPGLNRGDIAWQMWWYDGDPAQLVESVSQNWNALINDVNK